MISSGNVDCVDEAEDSVPSLTEDKFLTGQMLKGILKELYFPVDRTENVESRMLLKHMHLIQNRNLENTKGLNWIKRSQKSSHSPFLWNNKKKEQKRTIYWSKRGDEQDFEDFLPFSAIIRHEKDVKSIHFL